MRLHRNKPITVAANLQRIPSALAENQRNPLQPEPPDLCSRLLRPLKRPTGGPGGKHPLCFSPRRLSAAFDARKRLLGSPSSVTLHPTAGQPRRAARVGSRLAPSRYERGFIGSFTTEVFPRAHRAGCVARSFCQNKNRCENIAHLRLSKNLLGRCRRARRPSDCDRIRGLCCRGGAVSA